jgi:hypothetical protein
MRRFLALSLVAAAAVVAAPSIAAGGGGAIELEVELVNPSEPLVFRYTFPSGTCEQDNFAATIQANGNEVLPLDLFQSDIDSDVFTFRLPSDTPGGVVGVAAECRDGENMFRGAGEIEWGSLTVTKVVAGSVPSGTVFGVNVDCEGTLVPGEVGAQDLPLDFTVDLSYPSAGGVHYVYTDHPVECAVTEPVNGGATSVTIDPDLVDMTSPGAFTSTVTNTFPVAVQPTFTG